MASSGVFEIVVTSMVLYARFPPFRCLSSVAILPFPLAVAVSVHRCRCRIPWLVGVDDWLASYGTEQRKKTELDPISTAERLRQLLTFTAVTERNFLT